MIMVLRINSVQFSTINSRAMPLKLWVEKKKTRLLKKILENKQNDSNFFLQQVLAEF